MTAPRITIDTPVAFSDPLPEAIDVAIIGGGVIGIFSALYLARRGKRVLVCEKGRVAGEQSSRNWGWIRQQGRDPAELPIMMKALDLWHEANRETNGACGVRTCGISYLARSRAMMESYLDWLPVARDAGLGTRELSGREAAALFSGEARNVWLGGIHTPNDARGEPWRAVPAVARLAHEAGALIRENCAVRALDIQGGTIRGIVTEDGRVACEQVILAGGAWSALFARQHGIPIPQLALRGTVGRTAPLPEFFSGCAADEDLALRRRDDGRYTLTLAERHGFYLGPDAFRNLLSYLPLLQQTWKTVNPMLGAPAGFPDSWSTRRRWSEDEITPFETMRVLEPRPDQRTVALMIRRFQELFPKVGQPRIETQWAGMVDTMPDVVPIVDRVPGTGGLIVATGMSGHGFGIGPGFAAVIAQMAAGESLEFDMHRFRFTRFSDGSKLELGTAL